MKHFFALLLLSLACMAHPQSPYINKVYEYMPAPGQFVNEIPFYDPGDTQQDMNRKAEEYIAGTHHNEGMITLGGFGGYIVFGFDHPVKNIPGKYDFRILGNAFYANDNPNDEASREGGSCEPGIVMVARDDNDNGLPDDTWYELAGSEYHHPQTIYNYRITYYKPDENKPRDPDPEHPFINDRTYIRWTTNGHGNGYLYRNSYHPQSYYPLWVNDETISFEGAKLPDNYVDESGLGLYYVLYACHWGYADNHLNNDNRSGFNIEWAVDAGGKHVSLPDIDFVKVYTGVNQYCGRLGETSTEISGAEDLHLTGRDATVPVFVSGILLEPASAEIQPGETTTLTATVIPHNATQKTVTWKSNPSTVATVNNAGLVTALETGVAIIQAITNDGYYIASSQITVRIPPPPQPVAVTGITLTPEQAHLQTGESLNLTATVTPQDAANKNITWTSSNAGVAEVTVNGRVIAFAAGTTVINAITVDGGHSASCHITVSNKSPVEHTSQPEARAFFTGNTLRLLGLEAHHCVVVTPNGHTCASFRIAAQDETLPWRFAPGFYILVAQKHGERKVFKIIAGNG
ncbi:MAG: Ig-like domain-containing protein [Tannerella sp.]|nr:Ig-like domain-containing protein [Tannerella sp.]